MTYDTALAALADPTRREVFERLRPGPRAVGEIAAEMPVSRPAVSQHLKVLKEAGLVTDRAEGARRMYYIDPHGLGPLRKWLDQFWDQALVAFQAEVERSQPPPKTQSKDKNHESDHHAGARPQKRSRRRSALTRV